MTSIRARITTRAVESLHPETVLWDTDIKGFGCRRQRREPVYFLKSRFEGRQRWYVVGTHGNPWTTIAARKEAQKLLGDIATGRDPGLARNKAKDIPTITLLVATFLEEHVESKLKPSTARHYRDLCHSHILPALGKLRVDQVSEADVAKLHFALRDTPYQANRVLAVLSKMFSFAERRGLRDKGTNPSQGLERYREQSRERWLNDEELARLGAVLMEAESSGSENPFVVAAIKLLLFTGARLGEILTLKWDYIDLQRGLAALPDSKTGAKVIGLSSPAIAVLMALPRVEGNPFVLPGLRAGRPLVNLSKPWRRIRDRAGLSDVRLHDLRHNFGSQAAAAGHGLPTVAKQMGHSQIATTAKYSHAMPEPVREMNEAVGVKIVFALEQNQ